LIRYVTGAATVRFGETDVAGRRIAARAIPWEGEAGPPRFRFDPVSRTAVLRSEDGAVSVGPTDSEDWRLALRRPPAGPVLVGPGAPAAELREASRAAVRGALDAGRAVYLLDPEPSDLPDGPAEAFVAMHCGIPDERVLARLRHDAARASSGLLLPIVPGWTDDPAFLEQATAAASEAGARFVAGLLLSGDGESRRRTVAARAIAEPGSEDRFFDRAHHGDWEGESRAALDRLEELARRRGLATRPPRPRGASEPPVNAAASGALEELAERESADEHRANMLRAAVRWLDELGRDLGPVVAEGNFRKVFPLGADIAPEVERALAAARR
jgi:hypothetical protein